MKTFTLTFIVGLLFCCTSYAQNPVFTGNSASDFLNVPGHQFFHDFPNDVGLPSAAPFGTVSGWDIHTAYFFYDDVADDLYVGIDFGGIFGDAEGNSNPSTSALWLTALNGIDFPNLSNTEGFVLAFDNGGEGNYDVYVGVSRIDDITKFGLYMFTSNIDVAPEQFPVAAMGTVNLHTQVFDNMNPDLEFVIENVSNHVDELCGVNFTIFAGSYEDGPIGEDHLNGRLNFCGSLPVNFTDFDSASKGRGIQLDWNLATEINNDYFEIQHAADANSSFKTIGRIEGGGTTFESTSYSFYHDSPMKGNNYYRIKQVDFDGIVWYSWVITEQYEGADGRTIEVYPNPNKGEFMLGLPVVATDTEGLIRIMDTSGKIVGEQTATLYKGQTSYPVSIKDLPNGYYYALFTLKNVGDTHRKGFFVY